MGYDPLSVTEEQYTTPGTLGELELENTTSIRFKIALETGKIKLQQPTPSSLKKIEDSSETLGDILTLSEVDKGVLALALELKEGDLSPVIVSDDYSIQNVADQLNIQYLSLANLGIRYQFSWILSCPACHKKYPPTAANRTCLVCGTPLKRRVHGKKPSRRPG
jgi:UPF0271 protein